MRKHKPYTALIITFCLIVTPAVLAQEPPPCNVQDRSCLLDELSASTSAIDNTRWRDQTYREIAKTRAFDGDVDGALKIVDQIQTPDTQALTIRGIGMALAEQSLEQSAYDTAFTKIRSKADTIQDPPSYAIALTYIAMAQAFAGDNDGAWQTASEMENDALRHKAYGETAEIQAEHGDIDAALKSISFINSESFRNKAYHLVSKIMAKQNAFEASYRALQNITNAYKRAEALQHLLDSQKPRVNQKAGASK